MGIAARRSARAPRVLAATALLAATACAGDAGGPGASTQQRGEGALVVASEAFSQGDTLPERHTCDGEGRSPPLSWEEVPDEAAELAVLLEDPDAPDGTFVHWVAAGIDPASARLGAGEAPPVEGRNDFGEPGYGGPCPPPGDDPHRYVFTVLAVSQPLGLSDGASAEELLEASEDATVDHGRLTGQYGR